MSSYKTIYLADDDPDDRFLIMEAIRETNKKVNVVEVTNGLELLNTIQQLTDPSQALILLDMNMPLMNGLEAIVAIRTNPIFSDIHATMMSTSSDPSLAERAFKAGVNSYFTKPDTFEGFVSMAQQLVV
ncbi:response regulator [Dyadobacter sp. CY323]|uniref:response regulator n=1 Tax=Dyadobacter sp. CY323 TaxID=2907302 RepID=UPI001F319221|nr:response regulator [Dyadobacter sp. CY323]MCE6991910.1 response regulator [Dyadobacter sp. CY323]